MHLKATFSNIIVVRNDLEFYGLNAQKTKKNY
jgi:hypothetical protein